MVRSDSKYAIHDECAVPAAMLENWQVTVDVMAQALQVPAGLIMRVHAHEIEVLIRSRNPGNVYHPGEKADLDTGLYCETVMDTRCELVVPDSRLDPHWANNPDVKLGMISYCGLPLTWPDGRIFGTICVLDERGNEYSEIYRRLLGQFRDSIQLGLQTVWENRLLRESQLASTRAREDAEAASRSKSAFLSTMSHEMRTPMNAILGMTSLALRKATDARLIRQLRTVEAASQHLLEVINDVLEVSKIEAERLTLVCRDFALPSVFGKVRNLMADQALAKQLRLSFELPPPLENMSLNGDDLRLAQILLNYVGNAIKFTERGSIAVSVRLVQEQADGVVLCFEVKDSGIGIAAADQAGLFGAYSQVDAGISHRYGGTGLGLAICKGLAGLMQGEVGVQSAPGRGSLFWFTARLARTVPPGEGAGPAAGGSAEDRLRAGRAGRRVLLAEDDEASQSVCRELLAEVGIEVDLATDGRAAVERARGQSYDLILMDVGMPVLDGLEATRSIRALPGCERTPILAFTAKAFDEDRQACLGAGMNDHLSKPVTPERLYAALLKWLQPL